MENKTNSQKLKISIHGMMFENKTEHTDYVLNIKQENIHDQDITIKKINDEILIEIPDDSGFYRCITVNPKELTVKCTDGFGRINFI